MFLRSFSLLSLIMLLVSCGGHKSTHGCHSNCYTCQAGSAGDLLDVEDEQADGYKKKEDEPDIHYREYPEINDVGNIGTLYFLYKDHTIDPAEAEVLHNIVSYIEENDNKVVEISGHCDARESREYNHLLGLRRANAIKEYLMKEGVPEDKITIISYGKDLAAGSNNEAKYARDRRVEIIVKDGEEQ